MHHAVLDLHFFSNFNLPFRSAQADRPDESETPRSAPPYTVLDLMYDLALG